MKLNLHIENLVSESSTSILYHKAYITVVDNVLKDNRFVLSSVTNTSDAQANQEFSYFLSCARSKTGNATILTSSEQALFVLDGTKLGHNYKVVPVDYWGGEPSGQSEMEDRLLSQKPIIKPATKFIKELHILIDDKNVKMSSIHRSIIKQAKKHKIDVYLYNDKRHARLLNKAKAVPFDQVSSYLAHKNKIDRFANNRRSLLADVVEVIKTPATKRNKDMLLKKRGSYLDTLLWYPDDFASKVEEDFHNAQTRNKAGHVKSTKDTHFIIKYMQDNKLKDYIQLKDHLLEKWKEL